MKMPILHIALLAMLLFLTLQCKETEKSQVFSLVDIERERVVTLADAYIGAKPITVTDSISDRSAGGQHDFYSEGDYWWPDPENPDGPYIRKDGMTNPENFTAHRKAMIRLSQISGAMASAYLATGNQKYVEQLIPHLQAWFIDEETKMNPNLLYGQAIKGIVEGRGIGIIDTIHLLEVVLAVQAIADNKAISTADLAKIKSWFANYLEWMTTHPYGIKERDNGNNHSVCWALQVAVFAHFTGNGQLLDFTRDFYKNTLLPDQMDLNGSFPLELARTKPYGYSLFVLDGMAALCQILSIDNVNFFKYKTPNGKSMEKGLSFLYPFVENKNEWPYAQDVMYWDEWPVRQPAFLFGGLALQNDNYLNLWKSLDADFDTPEVVRNMPVRFPLLWVLD